VYEALNRFLPKISNYISQRKTETFAVIGGVGAFAGSLIGQIGGNTGLLRIVFWDACIWLAIGISLSLMQSLYLRRLEASTRDVLRMGKRCALGGAAGGLGLVVFKSAVGMELLGYVVGWTAEGFIMGWLLAPVFLNLKTRLAIVAGAIAGASGAILGSLVMGPLFGAMVGTALADALKGVFLGLALTLTEKIQLTSEASLVVHWGGNEKSTLLLGNEPVKLGSGSDCQIILRSREKSVPPLVGEISLAKGEIILEDKRNGKKTTLVAGNQIEIFNVVIEVKAGSTPK
jgi:hypothetical protein